MSISEKTGKITGKVVSGIVATPRVSGGKFKQIGSDLARGYREVIPAKPPKEKKNKAEDTPS